MRRIMGTLALASLGSLALAQTGGQSKLTLQPAGQAPPAAPTTPAAADPRLDQMLAQWEASMKRITAFDADVVRYDTDLVTKKTEALQGKARFLRPDKASLYIKKTTNPDLYEHYLFTGTFLYDFKPQFKKVHVYQVANKPGQMVDDNFLNFLFGLKAEDAKKRYDLALIKVEAPYVYLKVLPKTADDQVEFTEARLVLWVDHYLPRQLEFATPKQTSIKWDILKIDATAKLTAADFQFVKPGGWDVEVKPRPQGQPPAGVQPVPAAPQPSKVRPAGG